MSKTTGHTKLGAGTCRISKQFARELDGLYGYSIKIISVFFFLISF